VAADDLNAGEAALGGRRLLDCANAQVNHRGEFILRKVLERRRSRNRKGDDVGHPALVAKEVTWSRCD